MHHENYKDMRTNRNIIRITFQFCIAVLCCITANAQNLNNPNKLGPLGVQVNTLTGNLFIPRTDAIISARSFNIDLTFYYNSYGFPVQEGFGKGWDFQYNIRYIADTLNAGGKIIIWGDGREDNYDSLPGGSYSPPKGFFSKLEQYQPGRFVLVELDGNRYFFDDAGHGHITRMEEPNGNFITFSYTAGKLTGLTNKAGQSISLTYNGDGLLTTLTDAIANPARSFSYTYNSAGNLTKVTDPLNGSYQYSYLVNGPVKTMADRNNNKIDIIYNPDFSTREVVGCNKRISFSYDTTNNKTVIVDHFDDGNPNQVTTYTYKKLGNLSWITEMKGNCCGFNMSYEYDDEGNKIKETDANGQVYEFTYDDKGNMLTAKDPLGQVTSYSYTTDFQKLKTLTDPNGNLYALQYDNKGNLIKLNAPGGQVYTAEYNSLGDIIKSIDPKGNEYTYTYDAFGNPAQVTGPNNYSAQLVFDARGRLISFTDARGNATTAQYDILDRLRQITDPVNKSVRMLYDANGNPISFTDKMNKTTLVNYDASDRVVKTTDPLNGISVFQYDAMDNLKQVTNKIGNAMKMAYDKRNRLSSIVDAEGNSIHYEYDGNGNITSAILANGQVLTYTYDAVNRLLKVNDPISTIAMFEYDANGNITKYTNATGALTSAIYDSLNRTVSVTDPLGFTQSNTFDKNNNVTSYTDRNGNTETYSYDERNRMISYTDPLGHSVTIGYDLENNITSLTDQNGNITQYQYDNLNRRTRMTFADGSFQLFAYDENNNMVSKQLTDGAIINYAFDAQNRLTRKTLPDGEVYTYSYDAQDRIISIANQAGTVAFTYDVLDRITSETFDGRTVQYSYSIAGRTQTSIYTDGSVVIREFDARNRLIRILRDSVLVVEYAYNNANQPVQSTFGNGVQTTMTYDFANRLNNLNTSTGAIQNSSYTYDKERNKTAITRNNASLSETFTLDNNYRLTNYKRGSIENTYQYDNLGNRTAANLNGTSQTYSVNNLNQLTSRNGTGLLYDARGNLIFDGLWHKTYDAEGRLKKDSMNPANVITYQYDGLGRRVRKNTAGILLKYTYAGVQQIEERDGTNNLRSSTVFSHFLKPVANDFNGARYFYHPNEQLSIEAITNANGRLLEQYRYDAYGGLQRLDSLNNPLAGSLAGNRFGFTGQEYDSATGSYRFFYRNYSPGLGVFNQRDLIEYEDGMGMYQYVGNNPANGIDVWGLCSPSKKSTESKKEEDKLKETKDRIKWMKEKWKKYGKYTGETMKKGGELTLKIVEAPMEGIETTFKVVELGEKGYNNSTLENTELSVDIAMGTASTTFGVVLGLEGIVAASGGAAIGTGAIFAPATVAAAATGAAIVGGYKGANALSRKLTGKSIVQNDYVSKPGALIGEYIIGDYMETRDYNRILLYHQQNGREQAWLDAERKMEERIRNYKNNCPEGGKRDYPYKKWDPITGKMIIVFPLDPNEIIGPEGVQLPERFVSKVDAMPYTILFENDTSASAPAKYVRISTKIEPKQDPATFQLANFGFNNQTFEIPESLASWYQRLDLRDSMNLFVDITAGYDQISNEAFWEFRSIDPITLLPSDDPLAGFLYLQDTAQPAYGNGFVNFRIRARSNAVTGDTIGAQAQIVFDENDTIPTNIYTNTIDAVPPASRLEEVTVVSGNTVFMRWSGQDDPGGAGIDFYSIYITNDNVNYSELVAKTQRTDTTMELPPNGNYCLFVIATDRVGNQQPINLGDIVCASVGNPLPVTWLYFTGINRDIHNHLSWATASEQNSKEFIIERSFTGSDFSKIGSLQASGNSAGRREYEFTDKNINKLGSPVFYYRLKQVDNDGKFRYSSIVKLTYRTAEKQPSIVYPNPTKGLITIAIGDKQLIKSEARILDINGRIAKTITIISEVQTISLDNLAPGIYFIRLTNGETMKIMKQ